VDKLIDQQREKTESDRATNGKKKKEKKRDRSAKRKQTKPPSPCLIRRTEYARLKVLKIFLTREVTGKLFVGDGDVLLSALGCVN
jgi:hypothetical protein